MNVSGSETDTKYHHFSNPTDLKFYFTEFENNSQRRLYREDPLPKKEDFDEIYQRQTDKLRKTKHFALDNPQPSMDNLVRNKMEQTGQFSSESDNQNVLSDPETDLKLDFQKAENYKIFVNISSDLPYPFWVNGNSIKTASHSNKLLKPDWKNLRLVDKSDRNDGEFKNSKYHGHGVFDYADGKRYEGKWVNDKKDGHGVLTWPDGDYYKGEWKAEHR